MFFALYLNFGKVRYAPFPEVEGGRWKVEGSGTNSLCEFDLYFFLGCLNNIGECFFNDNTLSVNTFTFFFG